MRPSSSNGAANANNSNNAATIPTVTTTTTTTTTTNNNGSDTTTNGLHNGHQFQASAADQQSPPAQSADQNVDANERQVVEPVLTVSGLGESHLAHSAPSSPKAGRKVMPGEAIGWQQNEDDQQQQQQQQLGKHVKRTQRKKDPVTNGREERPIIKTSASSVTIPVSQDLPPGSAANATLTSGMSISKAQMLMDPDLEFLLTPQPPLMPTSNNKARQKKFMKTFSQLPQEEIVLQRYSCALVGDILLQGHLYITENYFAFYSNVFGYITKLQIPIQSVVKVSKEKTAKFIPNAVGLETADEKHVFGSLLSRDSTFKFMTHVWKRAIRESMRVDMNVADVDLPLDSGEVQDNGAEGEDLDDVVRDLEPSSESDVANHSNGSRPMKAIAKERVPPILETSPLEASYLVKRMSTSGAKLRFQSTTTSEEEYTHHYSPTTKKAPPIPESSWSSLVNLSFISSSALMSILVVALLFFLLCSSIYLVFRVNQLQNQVESRLTQRPLDLYASLLMDTRNDFDGKQSDKMRRALHSNVDQITEVRKHLEKLSRILSKTPKADRESANAEDSVS